MFLKRIELSGFKSFADKSIIHFDSEVTGIVGPNGCGKSNINDAIRWVLGEQSVKSLRGNSMSDVIFNGSSQRKPLNVAEVTLVFDNSKRLLHIEYDEVEITRRLHRQNNDGEYYINKTQCRLKDIVNLVMDSGLGRDSLSIISQGNISAFADSKPEDRRALFEEAAGVAKYKKRKNESLGKLNRTQENLDRVEDIVNEIERQLTPLEKQAEKAKIYEKKKQELQSVEISVLVDEIDEYSGKIQETKQQIFDLESKKVVCETTISVEDNLCNDFKNEMYELDRQIAKLQEEYTKQSDQVRILEVQKAQLDERRKHAIASDDLELKQKELKAFMEEANYEYENRKKRLDNLVLNMNLGKKSLDQIDHQLNEVMKDYQNSLQYIHRLENREEVLKNMMKSPFAHQHAQKALMDANLSGIKGIVSQLFKPKMNYEMAISSSLGGSLYHVVSKDEKSARDAIAFLKRNQSGRATFLPLTVMKPHYIAKEHLMILENLEGYLGCAYDFVEYEKEYEGLALHLFKNVVIVDDLKHANEIARVLNYQYKIVTLEGDVVNKGGSMSGGQVKNYTTPLTIQSELNKITSTLEGERMRFSTLASEQSNLNSKKEKTRANLVQMQIDQATLEPLVQSKWAKYERYKAEYEELNVNQVSEDEGVKNDDLVVLLSNLHMTIDEITSSIKSKRERRLQVANESQRKDLNIRSLRRELNSYQQEIRDLELLQVRYETKLDTTLERLRSAYEMTLDFARNQVVAMDMTFAKEEVVRLRKEISSLGHVNLDAPKQYDELNERYTFLDKQRNDLLAAKNKIMNAIDEMDEIMIKQFKEMFDKINAELDGVFKSLFGGGKAKLFMVDPNDILNTGIDIDVQPPGKNVQNIRLFSGGEKSLIAICVLFSILKARVIPLCIFDEVEAALDQANVERFAKYLAQFRDDSQFIVVTHRPGTMEQCDCLYGVTMQQNGVSSLLKVKLQDALNMVEEEVNG